MKHIETLIGTNKSMKTKPLTFLLALTFLFLFSGSVYGQEEVKKEYYGSGELKSEVPYKNGKKEGLETKWYRNGKKKAEFHFKNGKEEGLWVRWWDNGQVHRKGNYKNGKK